MTTTDTSILFYQSSVFTDVPSCGGSISSNTITLDGTGDIFGSVVATDLLNGKTQYRKLFCKSSNAAETTIGLYTQGPLLFVLNPANGGDHIELAAASSSTSTLNSESTLTWAGCGNITAVNNTTLTMLPDGSTNQTSAAGVIGAATNGSYIMISNNSVLGGAGNDDVVQITSCTPNSDGTVTVVASSVPRTYNTGYKICFPINLPTAVNLYTNGIPFWARRTIPANTARAASDSFAVGLTYTV